MPVLTQALKQIDQGHVRIIAKLWNLEGTKITNPYNIEEIVPFLLDSSNITIIYNKLPYEAQVALGELIQNLGKIPWSLFTRKYGSVREVGAGKRDRDEIFKKPGSVCEILWFHGLIFRDFFDSEDSVQEFAFIPSDLIPLLPKSEKPPPIVLGYPANRNEASTIYESNSHIIDHACTLLILYRTGSISQDLEKIPKNWPFPEISTKPTSPYLLTIDNLQKFLRAADLVDDSHQPIPERVREFLEASRHEALLTLFNAWRNSTQINEIRMVPGLDCQGDWTNNPLSTRARFLEMVFSIPTGKWWSIPAFIHSIKMTYPDFQRSAGEYESWIIRNKATNEFLRGYDQWDEVEGELIQFFLAGPLYWFGIVDLAAPSQFIPASSFRITQLADQILLGSIPTRYQEKIEPILVKSDATLFVSRLSSRSVRYQVARFCQWEAEKNDTYRYRVTSSSLDNALKQGLQITQLISLIKKNSKTIPPNIITALEQWIHSGSEANIEQVIILRVTDKAILEKLRKSKAARFLGIPLSPTTIVIKKGSQEKILAFLAEQGYIGDIIS